MLFRDLVGVLPKGTPVYIPRFSSYPDRDLSYLYPFHSCEVAEIRPIYGRFGSQDYTYLSVSQRQGQRTPYP